MENTLILTEEEKQDNIEKELIDILPHGSGIDFKWEFIFHKNGNITCKNGYHAMDENGYYDGVMDFKVNLFKHKKNVLNSRNTEQLLHHKGEWDFKIVCNNSRKSSFNGLKDYLYDIFHNALSHFLKSLEGK